MATWRPKGYSKIIVLNNVVCCMFHIKYIMFHIKYKRHHGWFSRSSVSLQQLLDIHSGHWACQQTGFWVSAPCYCSPTDQYDGEDGVVLDDVYHRVKHLRSRTGREWQCEAFTDQSARLESTTLTLFKVCCIPRAYLPVSLIKRIFTL